MKNPIKMSLALIGMLFVNASAWAQEDQSFKFECMIRGQGTRDWITLTQKSVTLDPGKEVKIEISFTTPENQLIVLEADAVSFLRDLDFGNGNVQHDNMVTATQVVRLPNNKVEIYDMSKIGMAGDYRGGSLVDTGSVVKLTSSAKTYIVGCSVYR